MFKRFFLISIIIILFIPLFSQYNFITIKGNVSIIKCDPTKKQLGTYLSIEMDKHITHFQKQMGVYPDNSVEFIIAPSEKWYRSHTSDKQEIIKQANAFYSHRTRAIIIRPQANLKGIKGLKQVFLHEYIHYFIDSYIDNAPLWFHEGMAVYFSGQHSFNMEVVFAHSYLFGTRARLTDMRDSYPQSKNDWEAFYAVSSLAVKTLYKEFKPGFFKFWYIAEELKSEKRPVPFSRLFNSTFFMTTTGFDKYFASIQKNTFLGHLFGVSASLVGPLLTVFLIIAYIKKRKKYKLLVKQLEEEEQHEESLVGRDSIPERCRTEESSPTE